MNSMERDKYQQGYSLLEVLVALVILAVIIMPLLSLFIQGHSHNRSAGLKTRAVLYGQEEMERLKNLGFDGLRGKVAGGSYLLPEGQWEEEEGMVRHYRLELVNQGVEGTEGVVQVQLIKVQVHVGWIEGEGREREITLASCLAEVVENEGEGEEEEELEVF